MSVTVETYQIPYTGTALSPDRPTLEDEIREHELVAIRNEAARLELNGVQARCNLDLARLRISRTVPFPIMTAEEQRVWRAFLPTVYSSAQKDWDRFPTAPRPLSGYRFDLHPLSVLELWNSLLDARAPPARAHPGGVQISGRAVSPRPVGRGVGGL